MLLIGWIDYRTTDFAITLFYFAPVVLATWRAGRKAAGLCGTLWSDSTHGRLDGTPPAGTHCARYFHAGYLVLASAALAELVISSRRAHERLKALLALKTFARRNSPKGEEQPAIVSSLLRLQI